MFASKDEKKYLSEKELNESYNKLLLDHEKLESITGNLISSEENLRKQVNDLNITINKLIVSDKRLNKAQSIGKIGNWELDLINQTVFGSSEAFRIYGVGEEKEIVSLPYIKSIVVIEDISKIENAMNLLIKENIKFDVEFRIKRDDNGEERYIHSLAKTEYDATKKYSIVLGVIQDITEQKQSEHIISQMAYYDDLTNLPNRVFFFDKLQNEINDARKNCTKLAVLLLDIDNFKRINGSLGHYFGDELLKEASKRLKECLSEVSTEFENVPKSFNY